MGMIMKAIYLKIAGCVVLALAVIIGIAVFWPGGASGPAEPQDTEQVQKQADAQPKAKDVYKSDFARAAGISRDAQLNPQAEKLYQTALRHKKPGSNPADSYKILAG